MKQKNTPGAYELSSFCSEIAMMLSAGVTLYDGLEALAETYRGTPWEERYAKLYQAVLEKGTLCAAMRADTVWPAYLVEMTGIGERVGRLEDVMRNLSAFYEHEDRIRRAVRSAVTYPLVLSVMLVLIILVMILKVVPVFNRVLSGMGVAMNAHGMVLSNIGSVLGITVMVIVGVVIAAVLVILALLNTKKRDAVLGFLRETFPPLRAILVRLAAARVAELLSMMISGGFPLEEALEIIPLVLEDRFALKAVASIRNGVLEGKPLADAIDSCGLFDEVHARMIAVGIRTGHEVEAMSKVASVYQEEVEDGIAGMIGVIEPTLVAVLSVIIGAILLSVMLPMAGIISSIL